MTKKAKILTAPPTGLGFIPTTTKNTGISQRQTLEETMINLATSIGVKEIYKTLSARGAYFYQVQAKGFSSYQSASNTILELSQHIAAKSPNISSQPTATRRLNSGR